MEADSRATILEPADAELAPELEPDEAAPVWVAVSRGVMCFLGFFALLSLLAELRQPAAHSDLWWLDLRCPTPIARAGLSLAAALLLAFAVRPTLPDTMRRVAVTLTAALLGLTVWRTLGFYSAVRAGTLQSELALPFSLHFAACLTVVLAGLRVPAAENRLDRSGVWLFATGFLVCAITFPVAQIYCLGHMSYRRSAEAVLVQTGVTDNSDGESPELAACLQTACALIREGLADELILAAAAEEETEAAGAMHRRAIAEGVPAERIRVLTANTIAEQSSGIEGSRPILAVGRFHELPRLRLLWSRTGRELCTVPVRETRPASELAWQIAREVTALWSCYLRPFAG